MGAPQLVLGAWSSLSDARAGDISLTGLGAVFAGLLILFGAMALMGWILHGRKVARAAAVAPPEPPSDEVEAEAPPVVVVAADDVEPEEEPFVLPKTPETLVPSSLVSAAVLALHFYDKGALALGETRRLDVDGIPRTVTLLAEGFMNRARVDGEEVIFSRSRIAPQEAV